MDESERIRREIIEASEHVTSASAEWDRVVGRSAAHRAQRERWKAGPPPARPEGRTTDQLMHWAFGHTSEERDYLARVSSTKFEKQREALKNATNRLLTPALTHALKQLSEGDARGADYGIAFLEGDPWCFRSGYLKGDVSRYLRKVDLSPTQKERIRTAILNNLNKGRRLEFGETRKLARRLDTPNFRKAIEKFLNHPDAGTSERASLLLASCALNDTRKDLRGAR